MDNGSYGKRKELELLEVPLEGTALVESGAGTGKTFAIAGLYLRFLLEKGFTTSEILVVTYTRAATDELKGRIRSLIRGAVSAFAGHPVEEPLLRELATKCKTCGDPEAILTEALRAFDEAAIYTIHGFCGRLLLDHAFESGALFDTELVTETEPILMEAVCDFWRKHLVGAEPEVLHCALNQGFLPHMLLRKLQPALIHPDLRVIPEPLDTPLEGLAPYRKAREELAEAWPEGRETLRETLLRASLNGKRYGTPNRGGAGPSQRELKVEALMASVDRYLSAGGTSFPPPPALEQLAADFVASSVLKGKRPPEHPLFFLCERAWKTGHALEKQVKRFLLSLQVRLCREVRHTMRAKMRDRNRRTYDDLIQDVKAALDRSGRLSTGYRAALVDEFQDTDPFQFEIFRNLFAKLDKALFLIGDPKQAVYGFRGADLFTYLRAASDVTTRYTLTRNWRSDPDLIQALNTVYRGPERPFVHDQIAYAEAVPAQEPSRKTLHIEGEESAPFRLWVTGPGPGGKSRVNKGEAQKRVLEGLVTEIGRLVRLGREGKALLGEEPLREGHMAVLVRKNSEARMVQKALSRARIPAVLYSADNLFDSREAVQMEILLRALVEPDREERLRAALLTDMMGLRGEELEVLGRDEAAWESLLERMAGYRILWEEAGFLRMILSFINEEGVRPRLLAYPDGERRLTNVLHLAEVLHRRSVEGGALGPQGLLQWLQERLDPDTPRREEDQLRLESDEDAVTVITLHRSKGLQFPVVFCPFPWEGCRTGKGPLIFHDPARDGRLTMDLGSDLRDEHRPLAEMELLGESLRLLYVGLTRARNRCYLAWGPVNRAETSAPAFLFHHPPLERWDTVVDALASHVKGLSPEEMRADLEALEEASGGTIVLASPPGGGAGLKEPTRDTITALEMRIFSGSIRNDWQVTSFSSLVSNRAVGSDLPDYDEGEPLEPVGAESGQGAEPEEAGDIFAFPKGAAAGIFFHDLMEHLDFTDARTPRLEQAVEDRLKRSGFGPEWKEPVSAMVRRVLSAPLDPSFPGLVLEKVGVEDRLNELEFYFPLRTIDPERLARAFSGLAPAENLAAFPLSLEGLRFDPARGFMKGFMDLVFRRQGRYFLVDWKSNHLGNHVTDYDPSSLARAMREELYVLQYLIYTLALDRYLSMRVPGYRYETHFGGVYYLFLRGVDPEAGPDYGIYRDRPPAHLMARLRDILLDEGDQPGSMDPAASREMLPHNSEAPEEGQ